MEFLKINFSGIIVIGLVILGRWDQLNGKNL